MTMLLRGIIIGLSIAAPVGPIGMLCIRRTLAEGRLAGLVSGLGAASADMLYGCIAGFGLTFISSIMVQQQMWLRLVGGLFLCYLGAKICLTPPAEESASATGRALIGAYASTFALTLTNPMTILSFAAIFAGLGLAQGGTDYTRAGLMTLGVFIGSALWWLLLSGAVGVLRGRITPTGLRWINRVSGLIVLGFGALALVSTAVGL